MAQASAAGSIGLMTSCLSGGATGAFFKGYTARPSILEPASLVSGPVYGPALEGRVETQTVC